MRKAIMYNPTGYRRRLRTKNGDYLALIEHGDHRVNIDRSKAKIMGAYLWEWIVIPVSKTVDNVLHEPSPEDTIAGYIATARAKTMDTPFIRFGTDNTPPLKTGLLGNIHSKEGGNIITAWFASNILTHFSPDPEFVRVVKGVDGTIMAWNKEDGFKHIQSHFVGIGTTGYVLDTGDVRLLELRYSPKQGYICFARDTTDTYGTSYNPTPNTHAEYGGYILPRREYLTLWKGARDLRRRNKKK